MVQLHDLARLIRAKNAGPFELTIDVMFETFDAFHRVRASGALSPERVAAIYDVEPANIRTFEAETALAIKVSFPRLHPSGSLQDTDIFGGQFHSPLVRLDIP